ncbi:hypothetical protein ZIOFF_013607 [Zingiber officinale]|uniref:Oligopeptide transporter n=1 Tax=Zingiber officinale TaxID=94328 RepID=A0A8J5HC05_ZINOF|nr:hypothetical protein ZIOFF_013607 [Zingiber officinale]
MDDSPIEQVRLIVPSTDDPTLQVLTFRIWILGVPLCILQSVLLRISSFRQQFINISSVCIDIFLYVGCSLLARVLPNKVVRIPCTRWSFSLNPCSFNIKEHIAMSIFVNSVGSPGFSNISVAKIFYHKEIHILPALLLVISTQMTLFYGRSLWQKFKKAYKDDDELDVHGRLMKQNYESIPQWWFYSILLSMIGMAILVCEGFGGQFQLRYWEVLLACALVFLFLPLECILEAIAGSGFTLDLLLEAIIGYLNPGKPLANMAFKLYGSEAHLVAASAISSFKASHYMKIPPKILFHLMVKSFPFFYYWLILGTTISCFTDFGIAWWMLRSIDNICQPDLLPAGSPWTCPSEKVLYLSGVTWGLVGPSKTFYPDGMYSVVFIFALIGLVAPIPIWLLSHKYPEKKWIGLINFPIIFSAALVLPFGGMLGYWSWFIIGFLFNYFIYHKHREWWTRYNYLLSVGLDAGCAFFILLLSVSLQFQNIYGANWWGLELSDHCSLANCPTISGVIIEGCPIIQ